MYYMNKNNIKNTIKKVSSSDMRIRFSEIYNNVRYTGDPVIITNHNDESVVMMRVSDVYPEVTDTEHYNNFFLTSVGKEIIDEPDFYERK